MLALYIIINHKKLLIKSDTFKDGEIEGFLQPIIQKYGGIVSDISPLLSYFPSNYNYSIISFLECIKDIYKTLLDQWDLVGFSIVVDSKRPSDYFEYIENSKAHSINTRGVNKLLLTSESYNKVSNFIKCKKVNNYYELDINFLNDFDTSSILPVKSVTAEFSNLMKGSGNICFFNEFDSNLYNNISIWGNNMFDSHTLLIDFTHSYYDLLTIILSIKSLSSVFDPSKDLTGEEKKEWGKYLILFSKFKNEDFESILIDCVDIQLFKLLKLWFSAFTKRHKLILSLIVTAKNSKILKVVEDLKLYNNLKIFIFANNYDLKDIDVVKYDPNILIETFVDTNVSNLKEYLDGKDESFQILLYFVLVSRGYLSFDNVINILKQNEYDELILKEELIRFKLDGLIIGENYLYSTHDYLLERFISLKKEHINQWNELFLDGFFKSKYNRVFQYYYIASLIGFDSKFKNECLDLFYLFIQKTIDLGLDIDLDEQFYKADDPSLKNLLEYKRVREARFKHQIVQVNEYNGNFKSLLELVEIQNSWSLLEDNRDLVDRSKELYYFFQNNNQALNESRAKIIFALTLLSFGRDSEAVDYFELNCSSSLVTNDYYAYVINLSFMAMSLFVKNDISGVLRVTSNAIASKYLIFKKRWFLYILFLRSRALGEIGHYGEAIKLLNSGINMCNKFGFHDILQVYSNWKGRMLFCNGDTKQAKEFLLNNRKNHESYLFLAEIQYFRGNIKGALEYATSSFNALKDDSRYLFEENLLWRDGFYIVEEFFETKRSESIIKREIYNFKLFLEAISGKTKSYEKLQNIVMNISNDSKGLFDYKYLFYMYLATNEFQENGVLNRENLYNKVLRLIQQKGSQLAEHNQKHLYLENFFNRYIISQRDDKKVLNNFNN